MTVFAVMTAGLFPILHLGRPWKFFWLIPYPNWRLIWPQSKSPLVWDVFAILTYLTISSTFLYIGLIPDIAVLRDRETNPMRKSIFAHALARLAELRSRVAALHARVSVPRRVRDAARALGALGRVVRLRDGADVRAGTRRSSRRTSSPARSSRASAWCSRSSSRCASAFKLEHYVTLNDLDAAAKLCLFTSLRRRPRVPHRVPGRVDERQPVRAGLLLEPRVRPVGVGRVDHADLQHGAAAVALLAEAAAQHDVALHPVALHQPRDVVRAVRDRRPVAVARVRAVAVGHAIARRGSTTAFCSAASAGSSCGSCCSSSSCP